MLPAYIYVSKLLYLLCTGGVTFEVGQILFFWTNTLAAQHGEQVDYCDGNYMKQKSHENQRMSKPVTSMMKQTMTHSAVLILH